MVIMFNMKLIYLIGVSGILTMLIAYLILNGGKSYVTLEAALHSVPTWFFGED
tara:strand:- start:196 stop:354 length:159 start_codon:yes stop_codon:yes gene_type:complete